METYFSHAIREALADAVPIYSCARIGYNATGEWVGQSRRLL